MTLPPLPDRDAFYQQVWDLVRQIPPGQVTSYGQVAKFLPAPEGVSQEDYKAFGARWVGGAMAACPADVPWQRVVNAQGKISPRAGGPTDQRQRLEAEGVEFDVHEHIDMDRFGWRGPDYEPPEPLQPSLF